MWALESIVARNAALQMQHDEAKAAEAIRAAKEVENCEFGCATKRDNGTTEVCPGGLHS